MKDTPPHVEKLYTDMLMKLSPQERLAMAGRMFSAAKTLVRAGILADGPLPEGEIRAQLFLRFYGNDFDEATRAKILDRIRKGR